MNIEHPDPTTPQRPDVAIPPLGLRPLALADADVMVTVLADPSLYEFNGGEPPTLEELTHQYAIQTRGFSPDGSQRWLNWVVVLGDHREPIGYVQATVPLKGGPTEVAWVIGRPCQGNGYATAAARLLLAELATQDVSAVMAHIHPAHEASQRIAQHLGLTPTEVVVDGERRWVGHTIRA